MRRVLEDRRGNGVSPRVNDESAGREQRQDDGEREQREKRAQAAMPESGQVSSQSVNLPQ